jgi:nitrogen regulatory protein P-II 2
VRRGTTHPSREKQSQCAGIPAIPAHRVFLDTRVSRALLSDRAGVVRMLFGVRWPRVGGRERRRVALQPRPESRRAMKLIIALIQPNRLEAVKAALAEVEVFRLTVMDVQGFGRQRGQTEMYRGHELNVNLVRKVQLMIGVNDEFLQPTIDAILKGGRSGAAGEVGDGKIFVLPLEDCIRIRTGERGGEAI